MFGKHCLHKKWADLWDIVGDDLDMFMQTECQRTHSWCPPGRWATPPGFSRWKARHNVGCAPAEFSWCGYDFRGIALTLGLVLKMHDTKQGHAWGTAAFHYASAVGALLIWLWIQSLPLSAARAGT